MSSGDGTDSRPTLPLTVALTLAACTLPAPTHAAWEVPPFESVRAEYRTSDHAILDRHGEPIQERRVDFHRRRVAWTPLDAIAPPMIATVIASEDRRFRDHAGIDWLALGKTSVSHVARWFGAKPEGSERGASTLSMQLASLLHEGVWKRDWKRGRRSFSEKWNQLFDARALERSWSKDQILEGYLNLISYRGELQGIASASWSLYGKAPSGLGLAESAVLSSLIRAPEARVSEINRRACAVAHVISPEWDCSGLPLSLTIGPVPAQLEEAPHLAQRLPVEAFAAGDVRSTLDRQIQRQVRETLQKQVRLLKDRNVHDAAALVVDHRSGEVLAYVGGLGAQATRAFVDGVTAKRQAGSTLKPFLYGLAIEKRRLTAGSLIDDVPTAFPVFGGLYEPKNFDHEFQGRAVPVKVALASSLNVPAVKTLSVLGVEPFVEKLRDFGIQSDLGADFYGPSLALGAMDVSLWELVQAYQALAEGGTLVPLHWQAEANSLRRRALSAPAAYIVQSMLSDRGARALGFGLGAVTNTRGWSAVKTGTSKDMRDNWCVGSSDRYTVGVWVGNTLGDPMWNVSGIMGAAPAWAEIMDSLHRTRVSREPRAPRTLVRENGTWYLAGTEHSPTAAPTWVGIQSPSDGEWIAHDPDIPVARQRIELLASGSREALAALAWQVDGQTLGSAEAATRITLPAPGQHHVALVGPDGQAVDSREFWVRGRSTVDE